MMTTPQVIEQYVLLASDTTDVERQREANRWLNHWVSSNDDRVLADAVLQIIRCGSRQEVVLFYALTVYSHLDNKDNVTPHQRKLFREELLCQLVVDNKNSNGSGRSHWGPTYLRTKVGVLLSHFIQLDFPHNWPSAFDDLSSSAVLQSAPDILLRTLVALTDEFGKDETETNRKIKNYMRGYTDQDQEPQQMMIDKPQMTIAGRLIPPLLVLLGQSLAMSPNDGTSNGNGTQLPGQDSSISLSEKVQIAALCLNVLKRFMSWVDLKLVLDEGVISLIFAALSRGGGLTSDADIFADAGIASIECMQELVSRGMDDEKKISILLHTKVLERIHSTVDLATVDASPIDVVLAVSQFINRTGLEILPLIGRKECIPVALTQQFSSLKAQLLDLFFRCFAFDDIDVSGAVIPLASSLVADAATSSTSRKCDQTTNTTILSRLLTTSYRQMRYPPDFSFDFDDDDEAEEELYRLELRKLNKNLVRAAPDLCLEFLSNVLSQLPLPLSTAPTSDLQASLSLIYQYCEGIRPPPGLKAVMQNQTFCQIIIGLHTSDIVRHPHREVILLYFEASVRYYPMLNRRLDLLEHVLGAMTGVCGLQHEDPKVRSRCCYLLTRLVKSLSSSDPNKNVLRQYIQTAVSGIQSLLDRNIQTENRLLSQDDTLNLFETIGLLLGKNGLGPTDQQMFLTRVITPHIRSIELILTERRQMLSQDSDTYGQSLSSSIAAIACLSKGFKQPAPEVQVVLMETLHISLSILDAVPASDLIRDKTFVLVQRLIQCLDEKVLPMMPKFLHLLIHYCTASDILDVSQLMNQLCIKFNGKAVEPLDANLLPFLQKCRYLSVSVVTQQQQAAASEADMKAPHLRIEQLSIQKLSYAVLQHIVTHQATAILLTSNNLGNLGEIMQTMSDGAINVEDPLVKKTCLAFFRDLTDQWLVVNRDGDSEVVNSPPPENVIQGFLRLLCTVLLPGMMIFYLKDTSFDVNDANHFRGLAEYCGIMEVIQSRLPDVFYQQVITAVFSTDYSLPQPLIDTFCASKTRKDFEESMKAVIQASRQC
jgi:exportin-T